MENSFRRQMKLPENVDMEEIKCNVNEKGKLTVSVPQVPAIEQKQNMIPINVHVNEDASLKSEETDDEVEVDSEDEQEKEGEIMDDTVWFYYNYYCYGNFIVLLYYIYCLLLLPYLNCNF